MEASQTSSPLTDGPWGRSGVVAAEESIKLIPKIRPSTTPGLPDYVKYVGHKALTLSAPGAENAHWDFDFVASPHTRQSSFFRVAGRPMADHFLAFYNAAIIAYGQTGSGKTHTMLGNLPSDWTNRSLSSGCFEDMPREAGLIPRLLGYIFQLIAAASQATTNQKQTALAPAHQQLPPPPPALPACSTPVADGARARTGRSGIPTPNGLPRAAYLTPPPASPQGTPEAVHKPSGQSPRNKALNGGAEYLIKASMLQIYQEVVTDLLNPRPVRLQIRESMEGGVMVVGLSEVTVRSAAEALQLLRVGTSHRAVAETASNPVSSRSHCILTLHMEAKDKLDTGVVRIRRSRLQLVDLAGSERTAKGADYASARQKETNAINKSLSTLGLVISRLTDRTRSQGPVPYRDSKLTFLLQDCLGGNAKTLIVANLNPSPTCSAETNMTLGFALRAKRVRNRAVVNEDHQGDAVVLQGEVRRLREELSIFRTLHAKDGPPRDIEELSAWRDQTAARVSQLHQALQLNGELEERLAAMEVSHSRLRMEHAALEEQCEGQRCEMSALEATVEQCTDELHELRERPTLEQLQAVEEQLRAAVHERDDARAQHEEALQRNMQLQDQCAQLTRLLETRTHQNNPVVQTGTQQGARTQRLSADTPNLVALSAELAMQTSPAAEVNGDPQQATVPESDYTALQQAYAELKEAYTALVDQNHQLMLQLNAAAGILEAASAENTGQDAAGDNGADALRRQHHRYNLSDSCLVSGGLDAVIEMAEEYNGDEDDDGNGASTGRQARDTASPSEQMRLASPRSPGCSSAEEAGSASSVATNDSAVQPFSGPPPLVHCAEEQNETFGQMRRRCRSQGSAMEARAETALPGTVLPDSCMLRHSVSGSFPDGHRSCDSGPPTFSVTNIRQLGQLASGLQCDLNSVILEEETDDAADARSLGTLVRVNPLFECRHGEDLPRTADCVENEAPAASVEHAGVTSVGVHRSTGSAEAPVGSDSLVCELPMPPDEQRVSPFPQGTYHSDDSDSTVGTVRQGRVAEGSAECSVLSDARGHDRALREIQLPNQWMPVAELRRSKAGLQSEPSLMVTPCSHPTDADPNKLGAKVQQVLSPSRGLPADTCTTGGQGLEFPASPDFAGRNGAASKGPPRSASSGVSYATRAALRASSPLKVFSFHNDENGCTPVSGVAEDLRASGGVRDKLRGSSLNAQSAYVTGVSGPSSLSLRPAYSASHCTLDRVVEHGADSTSSKTAVTAVLDDPRQATSTGHAVYSGVLSDAVSYGSRGRRSAATEQCGGPSWLRAEQLEENVIQLEDELARRLQGEVQLRTKLQEALTEAQSAGAQAANLLALNNGLIEEVAERDDRLRCYEDLMSRLYSELKAVLRQGLRELNTPIQHARGAAGTSVSSPATCNTANTDDDPAAAVAALENSEPVTVSPAERPRVMQSYEAGAISPLSCSGDGTPQYFIPRPAASKSASLSSSLSRGSRGADLVPSPLGLMIGSVQVEGPNTAMKTGLLLMLAKLRDGLLEREERVAGLEEELWEARSRLEQVEQELTRLQEIRPSMKPNTDDEAGQDDCIVGAAGSRCTDTDAVGAPAEQSCNDEHGFIAPPSPACSDTEPQPPAPWSTGLEQQPGQLSPLESSMRRDASLRAQLESRDREVYNLLETNAQLEASLQAALADRDSRVAELQSQAVRLANGFHAQLWKRDTQLNELENQVAELDASLKRATAETVRYRQQSTEAVEQCERYALELHGLERREEMLMNKLRALEMSLMHRGQEVEDLRAELTNTAEQLAGMRAKAMAAEVELARARHIIGALEGQIDDLRRNYGMLHPLPLPMAHRQQSMGAPHYTVATVRPTVMSAGGAPPAVWPQGQGPAGPYIYISRSDGGAVEGHAVGYQVQALAQPDCGLMAQEHAGLPVGARPLGRSSRNMTFAQSAPPPAPIKAGPGQAFGKGGGSRGVGHGPAAAGAAVDHGANKGTWVQRFLCRKGVTADGSPGQEAHVAILTPAKWRTKGMTGIVLRQWVGNAAGKNASRKGG